MSRLSAMVQPAMIGLCLIAFFVAKEGFGGLWLQFEPSTPTQHISSATTHGAPRQLKEEETEKNAAPIQAFETPGAVPDENYVLTLTILRVLIILYVGPCITFYGNEVTKAASFVQAGTASGFWGWWDKLTTIAYIGDLPPIVESFGKLVFMTGTSGLTMMISDGVRMAVQGMLLAYTFVMQIVPLIEIELVSWCGCQEELFLPAAAIRGQSYDAWVGCADKDKYYAAMWILKVVEWTVIVIGAVFAMKVKDYLEAASSAIVGADMIAAGIEALITDIMVLTSSPEKVAKAMSAFAAVKLFLCYGLSVWGFICQCTWMGEEWENAADLRWFVKPIYYLGCILTPMEKLNALLAAGADGVVAKGCETVAKLKSSQTMASKGKGKALEVDDDDDKGGDDKEAQNIDKKLLQNKGDKMGQYIGGQDDSKVNPSAPTGPPAALDVKADLPNQPDTSAPQTTTTAWKDTKDPKAAPKA